jgi:hypothetical protein
MSERHVVVVGSHWRQHNSELAFVTRSIAAAASRWTGVSVLVLGHGPPEADGAFDLQHIGQSCEPRWPKGLSPDCVVVVDDMTPDIAALLGTVDPRAVFFLRMSATGCPGSWHHLPVTADPPGEASFVKVYVPVNPLALVHRHNGFGFTGYQLALSGPRANGEDPPPAVAWLTAAFHDAHIVVVENAIASAWKGRALRGRVQVSTRMDLWRLIAHANVCIDLAPGRHIARECVEALRFGTPIIVPRDSGAAESHAMSAAGTVFGDPDELIQAAASTRDHDMRSARSRLGRRYADSNYGTPAEFTRTLRAVLSRN